MISRHEKLRAPETVHEPQRLVVSRTLIRLTETSIEMAWAFTADFRSFCASRRK